MRLAQVETECVLCGRETEARCRPENYPPQVACEYCTQALLFLKQRGADRVQAMKVASPSGDSWLFSYSGKSPVPKPAHGKTWSVPQEHISSRRVGLSPPPEDFPKDYTISARSLISWGEGELIDEGKSGLSITREDLEAFSTD